MPHMGTIIQEREASEQAAALAREETRRAALDELMADPKLLPRADAANAEIAKLEAAAAKATESFDVLDAQMQKATISGDEKELARLESLFGARKRLRDHAVDALSEAHGRHEMLRSAARIFREREQCASEFPSLEGRGQSVEEAVACVTTNVSVFRDSLVDCVLALADAIRARNTAAEAFDRRAESAGFDKRAGQVSLDRVLEEIVIALRPKDWMYSGKHFEFAMRNNGNSHTLVFGFSEPGLRP